MGRVEHPRATELWVCSLILSIFQVSTTSDLQLKQPCDYPSSLFPAFCNGTSSPLFQSFSDLQWSNLLLTSKCPGHVSFNCRKVKINSEGKFLTFPFPLSNPSGNCSDQFFLSWDLSAQKNDISYLPPTICHLEYSLTWVMLLFFYITVTCIFMYNMWG